MSRKSRKNVGVIGLGIIGSRVAAGLRAAGYQVYVWNRSAKPAPNFLGSPAEIAASAEIIQLFVADAAALFEVIEGMGDALTPQHVVICSGTVGPEAVLEAAQIVETKGAQFLDAPFTGSKLAAEKRQLVYYIGGSEHTFLKAKPILEVMSKGIVRIGEVGHASSVKVVTNMISAVTAQVLAEALSIVKKAGLEPEVLAAAIEHNACRSGVIDLKLPKMIAGDYDPHFSLKHMFKDVQLGIHMANALDIEIPTTTVTAGVMYGALNQGWGDLDFSALFKNYVTPEPVEELPALPHVAMSADEVIAEAAGAREFQSEPEKEKPVEEKAVETEKPVEETTPSDIPSHSDQQGIVPIAPHPLDVAPSVPDDANRTPVPEMVPTAAAAQMIEAMLSHTEGHGSTTGSSPDSSNKEHFKAEDAARDSSAPPEGSANRPPESSAARTTESGVSEDAKDEPTSAETPAEDTAEPVIRPKNFVRRWFVARSGG